MAFYRTLDGVNLRNPKRKSKLDLLDNVLQSTEPARYVTVLEGCDDVLTVTVDGVKTVNNKYTCCPLLL